jgi:hypothetical protein
MTVLTHFAAATSALIAVIAVIYAVKKYAVDTAKGGWILEVLEKIGRIPGFILPNAIWGVANLTLGAILIYAIVVWLIQ